VDWPILQEVVEVQQLLEVQTVDLEDWAVEDEVIGIMLLFQQELQIQEEVEVLHDLKMEYLLDLQVGQD
jgi:hypothetical protein